MFAGEEMLVHVSFDAAQARLADLARGGTLLDASQYAYGEGITGVARIGPPGSVRGMSRLAEAHFRGPVIREDTAVLTLRWEAIGPGGGLFPALDADITLSPAGDHATLLSLAGAYRPPPGALDARLDQVILQRVAAATIRIFLGRVADAIADPASAAGRTRGQGGADRSWLPPGSGTP